MNVERLNECISKLHKGRVPRGGLKTIKFSSLFLETSLDPDWRFLLYTSSSIDIASAGKRREQVIMCM
ncbi:hypothetical protein BDBG_16809 [Blastomyces gilchristii SLH14081]|uniref:Uncharacterized protein n=1 Tax=Blastomyces gilchristii (strain SLH14081) TaxID=559298 RepID=A0A179UJA7_BLAGS|nr:uncharacterized protein BDBG_16809 [Blastomyces gilchristii SLH14081]OAT07308.1 hypothetical protein BDBG_16809 [Blastomyces gilchristii SLH14081]